MVQNFTPSWKSVLETANKANLVKSPQVAAVLGSKIDAINGQGQGVILDATSSIGGLSGDQLASRIATPVASVFELIALKTAPSLVYLQSWDGTANTQDGGGLLRKVATAGTMDAGTVFVTDGGATYVRTGITRGLDPAWFGAVGDGKSHPASEIFSSLADLQKFFPDAYSLNQERDWLALQAVSLDVRGLSCVPRHYVMANAQVAQDDNPLTWISGITRGHGTDSVLDFSALVPVTTAREFISNSTFSDTSGAGWINASVYAPYSFTATTFNTGAAVYTDPASASNFTGSLSGGTLTVSNFTGSPPLAIGDTVYDASGALNGAKITAFGSGTGGNGTYTLSDAGTTLQGVSMNTSGGHYSQFGQQLTLDPGYYTIAVDWEATLGASYANGNYQPPTLDLRLFGNGPGNGGSPWGDNFVSVMPSNLVDATSPVTGTMTFIFSVKERGTAYPTLGISGYMNCKVTRFSVTNLNRNCAIVATRDGSPEHYPRMIPMGGFRIIGPGFSTPVTAIWWNSFENTDGTVLNLREVQVEDFGTGLLFQNGAYLTEFWDVTVLGCTLCMSFPPGSFNAGENYRFYGGAFSNSGCILDNSGAAEFSFYGTTLDYSDEIIRNNTGRVDIIGVHMEMQGSSSMDKPLYHCKGSGSINVYGGMFLGAGNAANYKGTPIYLEDNLSVMSMRGTQVYNLTGPDDKAVRGPGQFKPFDIINTGNPNMGSVANANSDTLGLAGQFISQPSSVLCDDGIGLPGGLMSEDAPSIDQWNTTVASVVPSTDHTYGDGKFCLKVTTQGNGKNDRITVAVPIRKWAAGSFSVSILFPFDMESGAASTTSAGTGNVASTYLADSDTGSDGRKSAVVYARTFWASVIGSDQFGRARFGGADKFAGESDFRLTAAGNTDWMTAGFAAGYLGLPKTGSETDLSMNAAGAPSFATHLVFVLETQSLPATTFYIGAFKGNAV